jgi:hypothetical protein
MWKQLLAGTLTAAVLGAGGVAVAGAVGGHSSPSSEATAPSGSDTARTGKHRAAELRRAAKLAADTIGVSVADLRTAVKNGQTVADVARAHSVDPQHVVDALVKAADDRIAAAVKAGKLSAARAAKLQQRVPKLADTFVNHTQDLVGRARKRVARRAAVIDTAASAIGVSADDLRSDLRAGQSIADVATAHHVAVQHVVDALVTAAKAKIDAAVKAGKLTPARAAALEQRLPTLMQRVVTRHAANRPAASATA